MVASNGYDIMVLAQTSFEAWRHAAGNYEKDWETLSIQEREAWEHVAGQGLLLLDDDKDEISAKQLASSIHEAYCRALGVQGENFWDLPQRTSLVWEAVGRHLFNLIDSDGSVEPNQAEPYWKGWVEQKLDSIRSLV
jgi:hypothetical protein